jgi:nitrite reductase (NADH) small subunit
VSNWIQIAAISECPPGSALELIAGERVIALFNIEGEFYALDGICPHQGGPLGEGSLAGCIVTCPWHGWQFDVRDGQNQLNARIRQPTLPVRIDGDAVLVDLDAAGSLL